MMPQIRRPEIDFTGLREDWFAGNLFISLRADAMNMLFPSGERFFVRSVLHYRDQLDDPELVARVRAFAGQEAMHGKLHEAAFEVLEAQGYEYRSALASFEHWAWDVLEPLPFATPALKLSVTAALEHLTAAYASQSLVDGRIASMDKPMADLLRWHAAEEIEHRDVAFDVLAQVDGRYWVRAAGMVIALLGLFVLWSRLFHHLRRQSSALTPERIRREKAEVRARQWTERFLAPRVLRYFRPGFHPSQEDLDGLAHEALRDLGMAAA